jgi:hypothetical protein
MNYMGKYVQFTISDSNYSWLMKVTRDERKRCTGDIFKHRYLSGKSVLIDDSREDMLPSRAEEIELLPSYQTVTSNVRAKSVSVVNIDRKEITSLFE